MRFKKRVRLHMPAACLKRDDELFAAHKPCWSILSYAQGWPVSPLCAHPRDAWREAGRTIANSYTPQPYAPRLETDAQTASKPIRKGKQP